MAGFAPVVSQADFIKTPLAYKWIISDAKTLFQARKWDVESPFFQVSLNSTHSSKWCLRIANDSVSNTLSLYLWLKDCKIKRLCIVDCTFSVLEPSTGETKLTATVPHEEYFSLHSLILIQVFDSNIDKFLYCGTLTIEVVATLFFLDIPFETVNVNNQVSVVPPDNGMKSLYEDKIFADVTIKCGDETFEAHKAILASQSPVFRRMLEVDMKEKSSSVIEIVDIDPSVMSDLLAFLYTGTAPNFNKMAKDLLNAANKYEVSQLFEMCEYKLQLELNASNVVILADLHSAPYLKKACLSFIRHNSANVYQTSQWKSLKQNCDEYTTLLIEILEFVQ